MSWEAKLNKGVEKRTILCVGLDTDMDRIEDFSSQFEVNREIISATRDLAAAYKPNLAFYEKEGAAGIRDLEKTVNLIRDEAPNALIILDAKKGDIGNTSKAYAKAAFEVLGVDAVTLNGYMGKDAVEPFAQYEDRLGFVLCRTSNRSANRIQELRIGDRPLYMEMARAVKEWNERGNLGLVVGATFPEELQLVRKEIGYQIPILVPGIGAQGGDLEDVIKNGTDDDGSGILVNVSRGIMFAPRYENQSLGDAARRSAGEYVKKIRVAMERSERW